MKFVFPLPLNLANSRMHWKKRHREKLAYWKTLDMLVLAKLIPAPPAAPLEQVDARATFYCWGLMDDGNAANRLKWVEDWLVERGYIKDDNRKVLRWEGFPGQVIDRKDQRLEVEFL